MNKKVKRLISFFAAVAASTSIAITASAASWQPDWAYYTDYDDAFMARTCSFENGGYNFEGIMGMFATSPYATIKIETGSSEISSGVTYTTKAECTYVDSSGNEQIYNAGGNGSHYRFNARGASQMFREIICVHTSKYNNESSSGLTIYP